MAFHVGHSELSFTNVTSVANHPQSLWITLWVSFRHHRQVAYPKGFFLVCSRFERYAISESYQ